IAWQRQHGRHALPWQGGRNAYVIWVSEIMLQQTQVSTVIPFYDRFIARFPDVRSLADAPLDDVLAHWSGLGYYSRARHLHAAARVICAQHGGVFPDALEAASALPGIGRSTASAILVFSYGVRHAILDGNVKRVLARCFGIRGYPGEREVNAALWRQAEALLPHTSIEAYTQGLMDLGALVCTRRRPRCTECPLRRRCVALTTDCVDELPTPRPHRPVPHKSTVMLLLEDGDEVLLEKRPPAGIWGGLWSFPELAPGDDVVRACAERFGTQVAVLEALPVIVHTFTHFRLTIMPQRLQVTARASRATEPGCAWWSLENAHAAGLPSPVRCIIQSLRAAAGGRDVSNSGVQAT
ncbi:MAG TPA: A/G-specific adenine glycosylase, partial [Burkholderiales bacterium]|nr:A/G-specific adenine glycosylase [Burkholderiales bacterium]